MDINSLMNNEPSAARDRPRGSPAQAAQHPHHQYPHSQRSPTLSRAPTEQQHPSAHHAPPPQQHPDHPSQRHAQYNAAEHVQRHPYQQGGPAYATAHRTAMQSPSAFERPPPPSLDTRVSSHGYAQPQYSPQMTPQMHHPGQPQTPGYPFPQQFPSPVQAHSSRPLDRPQGVTPARTPSQTYGPPPAASPPGYPPGRPPPSASHSTHSATPSSAYAQSPHASRDSSIPPHQHPHNVQAGPYRSTPSTPLLPTNVPPPYASRIEPSPYSQPQQPGHPSRMEQSPYTHHRSLSNASASVRASIMSSSPVSRTGSHAEPPLGYSHMPVQIKRPSNEHIQPVLERERSISVSPKTQVGTRKSSAEQRYAAPDSWPASTRTSMSEAHPHAVHHQAPHHAAADHPSQSNLSPLSKSQPLQYDGRQQIPATPNEDYRSHEMRDDRVMQLGSLSRRSSGAINPHLSRDPQTPYSANMPREGSMVLQQPISRPSDSGQMPPTMLKRKAESPVTIQEQKKQRTVPFEPPAWARLHSSNPGYDRQMAKFPQLRNRPASSTERPPQPQQATVAPPPPPSAVEQTNGHAAGSPDPGKKARISGLLGSPWEMSITETLPADRLLHQVAEFLYITMLSNPNLGAGDARNGALEIEAKIGTLVDKNSNDRLNLPVTTPCALHEAYSKSQVRFESFITENQHKSFNKTLNKWAQATHAPGRVQMAYSHRYESDSFTTLPPSLYHILPEAARQRISQHPPANPLRLRTTTNSDPKLKSPPTGRPVLAQIIKLRLADLDVFCPGEAYDVRISVNIEIDLHGRPDLDAKDFSSSGPPSSRDRHKNRLSYRHLTSAVDLTQVTYDAAGAGDKTHELEVEVDAVALRGQAALLKEGRDNAFEAVVEKFWSDVLLLVRVREEPAA